MFCTGWESAPVRLCVDCEKKMEKIFEQTLLYDFYGELLTSHQQSIYEDAVYNDLSLGEIAKERGISRQGVHDLIRRCDKILQHYESKLHLVERFMKAKEKVGQIEELTRLSENGDYPAVCRYMSEIRRLSEELKDEL